MSVRLRSYSIALLCTLLSALIAGCNDPSSQSSNAAPVTPGEITNHLSISGTPPKSITAGANYNFHPVVTNASSSSLHFSVANLPVWAKFDSGSGTLSGTPAPLDAGLYPQITISVSDGAASATLPPFALAVLSGSSVVATISWTPPTAEVNQTAPLDLAGYRIYYGTSEAGMTHIVTVADPTSTSYVVDNLSPGTWYFAVSSYDAAQAESVLSPAVAVTL
jgi:hypothetical protein